VSKAVFGGGMPSDKIVNIKGVLRLISNYYDNDEDEFYEEV
jgi:hypothetical protein